MKSILEYNGWKELTNNKWRRPGKKDGISATLGVVAPNVFFVFTSNAYPFEEMKAYLPFQVLALLKFNGDFKAAAENLPKPERIKIENKYEIKETELEKILNECIVDTNKIIEKPPIILSIQEITTSSVLEKRIFTLGNFSCIIGKAKAKKTFLLSLFTGVLLKKTEDYPKLIGNLPTNKKMVVYFDTEQGEYDCLNVMKRIEGISKNKEDFKGISLRQYMPVQRCQIIEYVLKCWGNKIGFCVIDGIADLANGINDEDEATRVCTFLLRLTKEYNIHIATVIHQNKNDNFATGHLGSSIMKKAEIIISVTRIKGDNFSSEVVCDMSRGMDFEPFILTINKEGIPEVSEIKESKVVKSIYEVETETESEIYLDNKPLF